MYPLVSVIIPVFKQSSSFKKAVDSVLAQTYPNIELIIIGSTQQVLSLYTDDTRIKYLKCDESVSQGIALNIGIDSSKGEYVTFLNIGNEYEPSKIEVQLKFMMMHNLDFCFSDIHSYNRQGAIVHRSHPQIKSWDAVHLKKAHLLNLSSAIECFMVKKDFLIKIGGFRNAGDGCGFMLMWDALEYSQKYNTRSGYLPCSHIKCYSANQNNDLCENSLYEFKCANKNLLTKKECRYIDFNHFLNLSVIYRHNKLYLRSLKHSISAFNISPLKAFKHLLKI